MLCSNQFNIATGSGRQPAENVELGCNAPRVGHCEASLTEDKSDTCRISVATAITGARMCNDF